MKTVKDFREQEGFTQSDLADKTGLSLRTIQRIESGKNIPKGYTLKVLSEVIGVNPSELTSEDTLLTEEQIEHLKFIDLSALALILIPFGNIIFPFIVWRKHKEERLVYQKGKYILNFQIVWSLVLSILLSVSPFIQYSLQLSFSLIIVVLILCYCFNIWMIFKFSNWISKGEIERLRLTFQIL